MDKVLIIAEIGVNHNGSVELAKQLIDEAKKAGVNAVKFQTFKTEKLVTKDASKAEYQKLSTGGGESQFDMLKKLELSKDDFLALFEYCNEQGIQFLSSPFDEESVELLEEIGVRLYKLGSGEITNLPLLEHIAKKGKPVILSTGMCNLTEVKEAVKVLTDNGNEKVTLLHCVTEYPAPYDEINLMAMLTLKNELGLPVGYSDHTPGIEIALAAVALGAEVIEKHFTLDRNMSGPDHKSSIEPAELTAMVNSIHNIQMSLGNGEKIPAKSELKNIDIARKSITASRIIKAGETISENNITTKRPATGISPMDFYKVIGKTANKDIEADEKITWEKLS